MEIIKVSVVSNEKIKPNTYYIKIYCPELNGKCYPGQFANIKVSETDFPLLRRPFSIADYDGEHVYFMYDVHGEGTKMLTQKIEGDVLDILIPLGNGFTIDGDYDTAVIIAGGIGAAPFPYLTREMPSGKEIVSFVGGRAEEFVIDFGMKNVVKSSDDGSIGFHGNVLELFKSKEKEFSEKKIRVFTCGPTPMLRAVKEYCDTKNIDCQVSTEAAMACGFGICQGCPCESTKQDDKYLLICKDGPVFNSKDVKI